MIYPSPPLLHGLNPLHLRYYPIILKMIYPSPTWCQPNLLRYNLTILNMISPSPPLLHGLNPLYLRYNLTILNMIHPSPLLLHGVNPTISDTISQS